MSAAASLYLIKFCPCSNNPQQKRKTSIQKIQKFSPGSMPEVSERKQRNAYATSSVSRFAAGTHPQPPPGQRPSGCRHLSYPRWRYRRGRGRLGKTSGTDGPWRPPSGGPSLGQKGAGPGSAAPSGWACSQLPWSSGKPGWGRCPVWPLAHEEPMI